MFTGIIEKQGQVVHQSPKGQSSWLEVIFPHTELELGESIAINGVCMTVAQLLPGGGAGFFISPETLQRSALSHLQPGMQVNIEHALTLQKKLSGHLLQGHVDGKARLIAIQPQSESFVLTFSLPAEMGRYCVEKGSIGLNGISLTLSVVRELREKNTIEIEVAIIPHTWMQTNLAQLKRGDEVNVEVDILAKYVAQYLAQTLEISCKPR